MHEQNFEKQVQQKMEELSLSPSAPVWQKVEEQIRKKKDRRRLIFWLLPLLLVGGGAGWMLWGTGENVAPAHTVQGKQPAASSPTVQQKAPAVTTLPENANTTNTTTTGQNNVKENFNPPVYNQTRITAQQPKLTAPFRSQQQETPKKLLPASNEVAVKEKDNTEVHEEAATGEEATVNREVAVNTEEKDRISLSVADTVVTSLHEEASTKAPEVTPPAAAIAIIPSSTPDSGVLAEKAPAQKSKTPKWQWTAHAEAGITSVRSSLFELPSTRSQDMYSSPTQFSGGNFFAYYPSAQEEGPAFALGFTAKRIINSRTRLTGGVQYNFYRTSMAVGQEKDATALATVPYARQSAAADNSYLPGTQNNYRNHYHFIQLPVGIEYRLFRRLPLQVHGGVSMARLVKTNALSYDYTSQAYYRNRSAYNATQWHLFTNVTYTLWKGKSVSLDVGPYVQYSLTELQKTATDKNRLLSAGLRTQFSF